MSPRWLEPELARLKGGTDTEEDRQKILNAIRMGHRELCETGTGARLSWLQSPDRTGT